MQTFEDYNSFGIITVIGENVSVYNHVCKVLCVAVEKSCGVLNSPVGADCGTKRVNLYGTADQADPQADLTCATRTPPGQSSS